MRFLKTPHRPHCSQRQFYCPLRRRRRTLKNMRRHDPADHFLLPDGDITSTIFLVSGANGWDENTQKEADALLEKGAGRRRHRFSRNISNRSRQMRRLRLYDLRHRATGAGIQRTRQGYRTTLPISAAQVMAARWCWR